MRLAPEEERETYELIKGIRIYMETYYFHNPSLVELRSKFEFIRDAVKSRVSDWSSQSDDYPNKMKLEYDRLVVYQRVPY
jgi:predicted DNA-binding protein YlxM (UPF0122 family)